MEKIIYLKCAVFRNSTVLTALHRLLHLVRQLGHGGSRRHRLEFNILTAHLRLSRRRTTTRLRLRRSIEIIRLLIRQKRLHLIDLLPKLGSIVDIALELSHSHILGMYLGSLIFDGLELINLEVSEASLELQISLKPLES